MLVPPAGCAAEVEAAKALHDDDAAADRQSHARSPAPAFREYPSLRPSRGAAAVAGNLLEIGVACGVFPATATTADVDAIVTPKMHGSNMRVRWGPGPAEGLRFGRRTGFFDAARCNHYGVTAAAAAIALHDKMPALHAHLVAAAERGRGGSGGDRGGRDTAAAGGLVAVTLHGEVYGGWYPHPAVPAAAFTPGAYTKPVQRHIWYAPDHRLVGFDVQLELADGSAPFLPYDAAAAACAAVEIPFVPAAWRGPLDAACAWAVAHAADNALACYNPLGLPLIEGNAGEGFVVRLAVETESPRSGRGLAKVKNPAFSEIAVGHHAYASAGGMVLPADAALAAAVAVAGRFITAPRAAAVASKMAPADVCRDNIKALAEALAADAKADPLMTPDEAAAIAVAGKPARTFLTRAFDIMRAFLTEMEEGEGGGGGEAAAADGAA